MVKSKTEFSSRITTSDSGEVVRFGDIICQTFIVVLKSRSKILKVSHNDGIAKSNVLKKLVGQVNLEYHLRKIGKE